MRKGVKVYQESQTFDRKTTAQAWIRKLEAELHEPGAIDKANRGGVTVKHMVDRYLDQYEKLRPLDKTKRATLNAIKETWFGRCLQHRTYQSEAGRVRHVAEWLMSSITLVMNFIITKVYISII